MALVGLFSFLSFFFLGFTFSEAQTTAAIYVFGDSLVDVGNNNYLTISIVKANHPHYGVDFPTRKPTGRFSNGKNAADFLAEKLGLATSRPYLSLISKANKNNASLLEGVSFASAGAGIFDGSDERLRQSIPLTKQVNYYSQVHEEMTERVGPQALESHLSRSVFAVVIGSNDWFGYFDSAKLRSKYTPQQYVDLMSASLKVQLKRLYDYGARKFEIAGVGAIGCCPAYRVKNKTECNTEANYWTAKYNDALKSMLEQLKSENPPLTYSYFDTYAAISDLINNPTSHGFADVKAACCGFGDLNAEGPCFPVSNLCSNREDHIFFDQYHPTEAAARIFVENIFDGSSKYTSPINMRQLVNV